MSLLTVPIETSQQASWKARPTEGDSKRYKRGMVQEPTDTLDANKASIPKVGHFRPWWCAKEHVDFSNFGQPKNVKTLTHSHGNAKASDSLQVSRSTARYPPTIWLLFAAYLTTQLRDYPTTRLKTAFSLRLCI